MTPLINGLIFLVGQLFDIYILIMMLRFLFQLFRVDFYNPFSQFIVKATNPLVVPVRRFLPGFGGIDLSTVLWVLVLIVIELVLITILAARPLIPGGLAMFTFVSILNRIWWLFVACITIQVIVSWINPMGHNPVMGIISRITWPVLGPAQRLIPPMGDFDFSPMVVLIFFGFIDIVLLKTLLSMAVNINGFNPL